MSESSLKDGASRDAIEASPTSANTLIAQHRPQAAQPILEERLRRRFLDLRQAFVDQPLERGDRAVVLQSADRLDGSDLEFGMKPVVGTLSSSLISELLNDSAGRRGSITAGPESAQGGYGRLPHDEVTAAQVIDQAGMDLGSAILPRVRSSARRTNLFRSRARACSRGRVACFPKRIRAAEACSWTLATLSWIF